MFSTKFIGLRAKICQIWYFLLLVQAFKCISLMVKFALFLNLCRFASNKRLCSSISLRQIAFWSAFTNWRLWPNSLLGLFVIFGQLISIYLSPSPLSVSPFSFRSLSFSLYLSLLLSLPPIHSEKER